MSNTDLRSKIREAFLTKWDPIGIGKMPEASNEYDGYIPAMCQLLEGGATHDEVFEFLWTIETETIGLSGNRQATEEFADWLCAAAAESVDEQKPSF